MWQNEALQAVLATGVLSSAGSVALFVLGEIRRRKRHGLKRRFSAASCCAVLGLVAGIVSACVLTDVLSGRPFLVVGLSTTLAMSADVFSRAGWSRLSGALLSMASAGIKSLAESQQSRTDLEPDPGSDDESR